MGGSTMLTALHAPEERGKVQGINDLAVFGLVAAALFMARTLLYQIGWIGLNLTVVPFVILAIGAVMWLGLRGRAYQVAGVHAMKTTLIVNDPPYGTERLCNVLRLGHALLKHDPESETIVFLMADAVAGARKGQKKPECYYNVERMLKRFIIGKGRVLLCGTCMDARGWTDKDMFEGAKHSTMEERAEATITADKVLVF